MHRFCIRGVASAAALRIPHETNPLKFISLRHELRPTIRLALPSLVAEIGWMSMGIVDTVTVGHLPDSARAIGSVSISSNLFKVHSHLGVSASTFTGRSGVTRPRPTGENFIAKGS